MPERKNHTNYTTVAERPLPARTEETHHPEQQLAGTRTIRLLLVDEHVLMREGLRKLLASEEHLEVVGEAANGWEALKLIQEMHPDIVLLELELPSLDGLNLTRRINRQHPECAILILAFRGEREQVVQALKSGARGYIRKRASIKDVLEAIQVIASGGVYVEPEMTGMLVTELQRLSEALPPDIEENPISEKEAEIIRAVARGLSNKEIARQLAYSEKTVKNYLSVIFQKLHLRDRTQVAIYALRNGLLSEEEIKQPDNK